MFVWKDCLNISFCLEYVSFQKRSEIIQNLWKIQIHITDTEYLRLAQANNIFFYSAEKASVESYSRNNTQINMRFTTVLVTLTRFVFKSS